MAVCPYHGDNDPSLAIYADHAYCFGCGTHRWADRLRREHPTLRVSHQVRYRSRRAGHLPRSLARTYHEWLTRDYPYKLGFLRDRGFTDDTIRDLEFGYTGTAYTIPIFDASGALAQMRFRRDDALTEEGPKYWGLGGSNGTALYLGRPLVSRVAECWLCEGEFDAALLSQHGLVAVSLTNGAGAFREEHRSLFDSCAQVRVAFDLDHSGDKGAAGVRAVLGPRAVRVVWPPEWGKDVTEAVARVGIGAFLRGSQAL